MAAPAYKVNSLKREGRYIHTHLVLPRDGSDGADHMMVHPSTALRESTAEVQGDTIAHLVKLLQNPIYHNQIIFPAHLRMTAKGTTATMMGMRARPIETVTSRAGKGKGASSSSGP